MRAMPIRLSLHWMALNSVAEYWPLVKPAPDPSVSRVVESAAEVKVVGKTSVASAPNRRIAYACLPCALLGLSKMQEREHCVLGVRTSQKSGEHSQPEPSHLQPLLPRVPPEYS